MSAQKPVTGNGGGLKGSMQHQLEAYSNGSVPKDMARSSWSPE
jgi:hypothetical protein